MYGQKAKPEKIRNAESKIKDAIQGLKYNEIRDLLTNISLEIDEKQVINCFEKPKSEIG